MSNLHNELKKSSHISLALRRMFGGEHELEVERLSETLQPVVNIWDHPYCAYLRGEYLFGDNQTSPAVALNVSFLALANPAASNRLVVIDYCGVRGGAAAMQVNLFIQADTTGGATFQFRGLDTRIPGGVAPLSITIVKGLSGDNLVPLAANVIDEVYCSTTDVRDFHTTPIILTPGFALVMEGTTVNSAIVGTWRGSTRPLVAGELT